MVAASTPVEIFCSYAHADEAWRSQLETHLSLLKRLGLVSLWYDRLIAPGINWALEIDRHLETASIILLLVSADFFASDYCYGIEMQHAMTRQEAGEVYVVPILVRPVDWKGAPFAHLQMLPTDARPIASWQNTDAALVDVTAGIRRLIEDLPLLAASAPRVVLPKIWNIPYPRNPFFLGRDAELAQMRTSLQASQAMALSQPQAISGLGGIGKTQLVLEYAYRYQQDYTVVLWAQAESTEALISSYMRLAVLLRLPECEAKEQEITIQAVKTWLQTHRDWLLILDNADELTLLPDFLPSRLGGHLLLTTRAQAGGRLAHRMEIENLEPAQGALLLLRRSGLIAPDDTLEQVSQEERVLAMQMSQELGGLPLALDQAGAYLEETGTDLATYWPIYQQHRADLLRERRGVLADHPASVAATWSLSFKLVEERNPAAAELLRMSAYLDPVAIPEEILRAGAALLSPVLAEVAADAFLLNQAIEALRAYSLLRRNPREKTLSIHRLVQAVLQDAMDEAERRGFAERVVLAVNAAFPEVEQITWSQCERLLPQALRAARLIEAEHINHAEAARLLDKTARYLFARARYREAESLCQRALHIQTQVLGHNHPQMAPLLLILAQLCLILSQYGEAEFFCRRALHIQTQAWGPENPNMADALGLLAQCSSEQGRYEEAGQLYQQALRVLERTLGPEHPKVALMLCQLGTFYAKVRGKAAEAERLYQRALRIQEQALGLQHPEVVTILGLLATVYSDQGKIEEAEPLLQRVVLLEERVFGPEHPVVSTPLHNLANIYLEQGKYEAAEPLYQRSLRIREQAFGPEHHILAEPLQGLANMYSRQGRHYEEAEQLYRRAVHTLEQALGPEHPDLSVTLHNLAVHIESRQPAEAALLRQRAIEIAFQSQGLAPAEMPAQLSKSASALCKQGKYKEAERLLQPALRLSERELGSEHPQTISLLNDLGYVYLVQGKHEEAEPLLQRAVSFQEQMGGSEHPDTAISLHNLADVYAMRGKYIEAAQLYQRALAIYEQQAGPTHPSTGMSLYNAVTLYEQLGKYEEVELLYRHSLSAWEQQVGTEHPSIAFLLNKMAALFTRQKKYAEAGSLYQRALYILVQQEGRARPETAEVMHGLAQLREMQGNDEEARSWYAQALAIHEQTSGMNHPQTRETRQCLIALLHVMGQHEEATKLEATQPDS